MINIYSEFFSTLTPVYNSNEYSNLFIKRDDLYKPFGENIFCGGKVRQIELLILKNIKKIKSDYNNTVVVETSVHSTSGTITAMVCKKYDVKCIVCIGGGNEKTIKRNYMMKLVDFYGAEINNISGIGYHSAIMKRLRDLCKEKKYFNVCLGDNAEKYPEEVLYSNSHQVKNIPDDLDNLIIPVGAGITMSGILLGIKKYNKKIKRIIGCHVGPDRRKDIDRYYNVLENGVIKYEMQPLNTVYAKEKEIIFEGLRLDVLYEAKSFDWLLNNINFKKEKTCFWNVGVKPTKNEVDKIMEIC